MLFEIHSPYSLDRIAEYPQLSPSRVHPPILPTPIPPISQHQHSPSNQLRSSVTGVFNAALSTKITLPSLPVPSSKMLLSLKRNLKIRTIPDGVSQNGAADAIPKSGPCHSSYTQTISQPPQNHSPPMLALPTTYALHPFSAHM